LSFLPFLVFGDWCLLFGVKCLVFGVKGLLELVLLPEALRILAERIPCLREPLDVSSFVALSSFLLLETFQTPGQHSC
jgi:hypothetical protein